MALSIIQAGDVIGTSGVAASIFDTPTGIGTCVAIAITPPSTSAGAVTSVTSPMGTFTRVCDVAGDPGLADELEWWVCLTTTASSEHVTVSYSGGGAYVAMALEWLGGVASASNGGNATAYPGSTVSLAVTCSPGEAVLVAAQGAVADTGGTPPGSPWTNVPNTAIGTLLVAYQVATASPATATWLVSGGVGSPYSNALGLVLVPSLPTPATPTLLSPANASIFDVSSGVAFEATYNAAGGDAMNAYAMRVKLAGGTYNYWNAGTSALQSSIVWTSDSVLAGQSFTVTLPSAALSDGNIYNWSLACQDAVSGGQGPFAVDFTFTAQTSPSVTVSAPSGTIGVTTQPTAQWTPTTAPGASQVTYSIIVESGTFGSTPGSGTQVWASGTVTSALNSAQIGTPLLTGTSYRAFVMISQTGGQTSPWAFTTFTISVDTPSTPVITATPGTDPITGYPINILTVQGLDNYLSAQDSSFEAAGIGTAVGTNCTPTRVNTQALDGTKSLLITPTAAGNASVQLGPYPCNPGDQINAFAAFRASTNARTCTVAIKWVGASGTITSAGHTDSTSAWTQATPTTAPPAGLIATGTAPSGATGYDVILTIDSTTGSGDTHFVDCVAAKPVVAGTTGDTTWSIGGFVGLSTAVITRSDNVFLRLASVANPLPIPSDGQLATIYDYEAVPGVAYTYSGYVQQASVPLQSAPAVSAAATVPTGLGWWELNPLMGTATTNPSAVNAQMITWTPIQTEQSTANQVINQVHMNVVANAMMAQDFNGSAEIFSDAVYSAFNALLISQATIFISSPWGPIDSGYFRIGPQSGGMSSGTGNTAKNTTLQPSVFGAGHRTVAITAIAQPRPQV